MINYTSALTNEDKKEELRQEKQIHDVVKMLLLPEKCFQVFCSEYYGHDNIPAPPPCSSMCPFCCKELLRKVNKLFLIDFLDADVFMKGPINPGQHSTKILNGKDSVFVDRSKDIPGGDAHFLILSLWCMDIITFFLQSDSPVKKKDPTGDVLCTFARKTVISKGEFRMNHRDE